MARSSASSGPASEMVISDIDQLRAISDPLRIRVLEILGETPVRAWTAKELAERLGTKQTTLYHHLTVLEQRGFIRVAGTRVVSGILEKRYAVVALSFKVDRALLAGGGVDAMNDALDAIFEKARNEILTGQRAGLLDLSEEEFERRRMALWSTHVRLSPASTKKVMRLIERLADIDRLEDPAGTDYGLVVAFYPRGPEGAER